MCRRLLADAPSDPALHQLAAAIARQRGDHQLARRWVGPFHPDRTARPLLPLISSLTPMMAITRRACQDATFTAFATRVMSGVTPDDQDAALGNLLDEFDRATVKLDVAERCPWSPGDCPSCRQRLARPGVLSNLPARIAWPAGRPRRVSAHLPRPIHSAARLTTALPISPPRWPYPIASEISNLKRASMVATLGYPQNSIFDLSSRRVPVRRKASRPLSWLRLG
jgi:hypothetical protein